MAKKPVFLKAHFSARRSFAKPMQLCAATTKPIIPVDFLVLIKGKPAASEIDKSSLEAVFKNDSVSIKVFKVIGFLK